MSNGEESLLEGLYESLITRALEQRLAGVSALDVHRGSIDEADEPDVLARHVRDVTLRVLRQERDAGRRLAMVNQLVGELSGLPRIRSLGLGSFSLLRCHPLPARLSGR